MRIVVFGAGGFVGGWICEELATHGGIEILACLRKWASAVRLARRGIDIAQFDLEGNGELASLISDADVVVNATMPPPAQEFKLAARLYSACVDTGVRRFIQFSSAAVYGDLTGEVSEHMAPKPTSEYGRGKAKMEMHLLAFAAEHRTQLIILRPSIVYGPFSDVWTVRYAQRIDQARWRSLGPAGVGICNLVHAQDVVRSVLAAARSALFEGSHIFNINGPELVTWNTYIERFGDSLGVMNRTTPNYFTFTARAYAAESVRIGGRIAKTHFTNIISQLSRSKGASRTLMGRAKSLANLYPTIEEIRLLRRKVRYSCHKAKRQFGLRDSISLEDGLRQSAEWCKIHGVV